jgi:2-octaprenylphenol hydroxylase
MTRAYKSNIIIVGGGLVGLMMANILAVEGFPIYVIDKAKPEVVIDETIGIRVSAINKASQKLFESLGLWSQIKAIRFGQYDRMLVWDEASSANIEMAAAEIGEPHLGCIVENNIMLKVLYEALLPHENVEFICDNPVAVIPDKLGYVLRFESGREINAPLLIGADGAKSWLRHEFNISSNSKAFNQHAVVCTVRTQKPHLYTAWQRFLATGPLAFLPLHDKNLCSIVWSMREDEALKLVAIPDEEFNKALAQAFDHTLGEVQVIGIRAHYPLIQQHAECYVKEGMALIGDAAHSIHPLAGQGVNLGFADAKVLAETILAAHHKNRNIASLPTLMHYQRARKHYNASILWSMYGFNSLFSNRLNSMARLREFGMNFVDKQPLLKRFFIRQAMGNNK